MTDRPILFTAENAQKVHDGRKTQTRRIIKPQPDGEPRSLIEWSRGIADACHDPSPDAHKLTEHAERLKGRIFPFTTKHGGLMSPRCPYGTVGSKIWIREAFQLWREGWDRTGHVIYKGGLCDAAGNTFEADELSKWSPSLHMKKAYCRTWLELTGVRVERVQEISDSDIVREGITGDGARPGIDVDIDGGLDHTFLFMAWRDLWISINGEESWKLNPWCWVLDYKKVQP